MDEQIVKEFKAQIIYRIDESTRMIRLTLDKLSEKDIWKSPTANSNSIGNLILHLCGNITQYAIASLGNKEDKRERNLEFETKEGFTKAQLLDKLVKVVNTAKEIINNCTLDELLKERAVQGYSFSGIGVIIHVTEHYSYHTGQIAFWAKQLLDKSSLGFYDGVDLTIKNKN